MTEVKRKNPDLRLLMGVRRLFRNMPTQVFRELVLRDVVDYLYPTCFDRVWSLETRTVTINSFDDETQRRMRKRKFGNKNPYNVPDDAKRMEWQRKNCKPGANDPVVVTEHSDGRLDLHEGWHRTMALLTIRTPKDPVDIRMWVGKHRCN